MVMVVISLIALHSPPAADEGFRLVAGHEEAGECALP